MVQPTGIAGEEMPRDPRQPVDFEPLTLGRSLLRTIRIGALGTLDPQTGSPLVTLTSVATDLDGAPIILISRLSHHTQNLLADERASLLLARPGRGDPLAHPRLTVQARAAMVGAESPWVRDRFLRRHPKARLYADFPDFAFFRLVPASIHLNGGFARAFDGDARLIMDHLDDPAAYAELESAAVAHLNEDHAEALGLYATRLSGMPAAAWRATGLDPHGLDLAAGDLAARVPFDVAVTDATGIRDALRRLADAARAATP
jgi:heme iron utilization protein